MVSRFKLFSPGLLTPEFTKLCLSAGLFMASFNMVVPELPQFLTDLGGEDYKGLIISLFAITAAISRPFSGKIADQWGRKPVMLIGALVSAVSGILYLFAFSLTVFFLIRALHGFSAGFKPTGDTAYLADVTQAKNRGEALGLLGMSSSAGMAAGPAIGSAITMEFGIQSMFVAASLTAVLSLVIIGGMKESKPRDKSMSRKLSMNRSDFFDPSVIAPSIIMILTVYSFGMALTIIPDFSVFIGIKNKGLFFTVMLITSVLTRIFSGRASDRIGRVKTLKLGAFALLLAQSILALATNESIFMLGAMVFGIAAGINSPTLFAWTVDLANPQFRGRAMSTLYIALEIGILLGAILSAQLYHNEATQFPVAFGSGAFLAFIAFLVLNILPKNIEG
jgi:MFS family permease